MPNAVRLVLKTFDQHPDAAFVYGNYQCFGSQNEVWRYPAVLTSEDFVKGQPTPGPCAYKVQNWKDLGGFAEELRGETPLMIFVSERFRPISPDIIAAQLSFAISWDIQEEIL